MRNGIKTSREEPEYKKHNNKAIRISNQEDVHNKYKRQAFFFLMGGMTTMILEPIQILVPFSTNFATVGFVLFEFHTFGVRCV